jgi:hypothetical protein
VLQPAASRNGVVASTQGSAEPPSPPEHPQRHAYTILLNNLGGNVLSENPAFL